MATIEKTSLLQTKDSSGNKSIIYPVTKVGAVDGLDTELSKKANSSHTHAQSDVTGLANALNGKANSSHTHAQGDITGLTSALNGKANSSHTHAQSNITGLTDALNGKAASTHTHGQGDITGLTDALNGKLSTSGGTITGNLTLKNSTNYGIKVNFGDGDYIHFYEPTDDHLEIKASYLNFIVPAGTGRFTINGKELAAALGLALSAHTHAQSDITGLADAIANGGGATIHISSTQPSNYKNGDMWFKPDS